MDQRKVCNTDYLFKVKRTKGQITIFEFLILQNKTKKQAQNLFQRRHCLRWPGWWKLLPAKWAFQAGRSVDLRNIPVVPHRLFLAILAWRGLPALHAVFSWSCFFGFLARDSITCLAAHKFRLPIFLGVWVTCQCHWLTKVGQRVLKNQRCHLSLWWAGILKRMILSSQQMASRNTCVVY